MLTTKSAYKKDLTSGVSKMEHRHFATIAAIIRETEWSEIARSEVERVFSDRLSETNPRFDRARFIRACYEE